MAELKTTPNSASVDGFLAAVADAHKQADAKIVHALLREVSGHPGKMWGKSIVGYGTYHYVYASGREGDWMEVGFSPRKAALTLYIMSGVERYEEILSRLGKYKTGKSCLYIKRLSDIDLDVLRQLVAASLVDIRRGSQDYGAC